MFHIASYGDVAYYDRLAMLVVRTKTSTAVENNSIAPENLNPNYPNSMLFLYSCSCTHKIEKNTRAEVSFAFNLVRNFTFYFVASTLNSSGNHMTLDFVRCVGFGFVS